MAELCGRELARASEEEPSILAKGGVTAMVRVELTVFCGRGEATGAFGVDPAAE